MFPLPLHSECNLFQLIREILKRKYHISKYGRISSCKTLLNEKNNVYKGGKNVKKKAFKNLI